jgi:LacI family transcriptional regulator
MATVRDVARAAGVSTATVSATINKTAYVSPQLQARVHEAIAKLGYHPDGIARSLKKRSTQTLGLLISDITNAFFTAVIRGIEDATNARGYAMILCSTDEDLERERAYLHLLRSRRVDGLIMAPAGDAGDYDDAFTKENAPVVFLDRKISAVPVDTVLVDNQEGTRKAIEYLAGLGHRRIGFIAGRPHLSTTWERVQGYRQALDEAAIAVHPELITCITCGHRGVEGGYKAGVDLLQSQQRPTAVFAASNSLAIGLMRAVVACRLRCPEDVSVACFDDFEWAAVFHPRLTTVAQPAYDMGATAAALLFGRLDGSRSGAPHEAVLQSVFTIRDSCRAPAPAR